MSMPLQRFHYGIDYGTSGSKIVVRDYLAPGRTKAYVVPYTERDVRFPSSIAMVGRNVVFGSRPGSLGGATWYESVKMRVADDVACAPGRYCYGTVPPCPDGLRSADLATLTIWWLISEAHRGALQILGRQHTGTIRPGMTLGVPMSFFRDAKLRAAFLDVSRSAWWLFRNHGLQRRGPLSVAAAQALVTEASQAVNQAGGDGIAVKQWIRSEAEAAVWWAYKSPAISDGPYAKIDIGAGTTNASFFRIVRHHSVSDERRNRMAFFGTDSEPIGMDALDERLASLWDDGRLNFRRLRGRESQLMVGRRILVGCARVIDGMHGPLRQAWGQMRQLNSNAPAEMRAWREECRLFVLGGGSLVDAVRMRVAAYPADAQRRLRIVRTVQPTDLTMSDGHSVPKHFLPFLLVAHGLSSAGADIPYAETPDEIPALPKEELPPIEDDPYAK